MLRYRAAAFFARLYAPDITLGMLTVEEAEDIATMRNVTPNIPRIAALPEMIAEPEPEPVAEGGAE
jgi:hypothetical protein